MTLKRKPLLQLRYEILERDNFICQICGKYPPDIHLEVDHIIPVAEGGTDNPSNLRASCFECNRGMGILTLQKAVKTLHPNTPKIVPRKTQLDNIILGQIKKFGDWPERDLLFVKGASRDECKSSLDRLWKKGLIRRIGSISSGFDWEYIDPYSKQAIR
jgi:hypothetical protein